MKFNAKQDKNDGWIGALALKNAFSIASPACFAAKMRKRWLMR